MTSADNHPSPPERTPRRGWREAGMAAVGLIFGGLFILEQTSGGKSMLNTSFGVSVLALSYVAAGVAGYVFRSQWGIVWWLVIAAAAGAVIGVLIEPGSHSGVLLSMVLGAVVYIALTAPMAGIGMFGVWLGRDRAARRPPNQPVEPLVIRQAAAPRDADAGFREGQTVFAGLFVAVVASMLIFGPFDARASSTTPILLGGLIVACLIAAIVGFWIGSIRGMLWWPVIAIGVGGIAAIILWHASDAWVFGIVVLPPAMLPPTIIGLLAARAGQGRHPQSRKGARHDENAPPSPTPA